MVKVAFYGYSGVGKSTTTRLFQTKMAAQGFGITVLKLAQPLYELQQQIYTVAGLSISMYDQDQVLLEMIAGQLRRISPRSIADDFVRRLDRVKTEVVVNDDIRDVEVDYPVLKEHGFTFVRIRCDEAVRLDRLSLRQDISTVTRSTVDAGVDRIPEDYSLGNSTNSLEQLGLDLDQLITDLI